MRVSSTAQLDATATIIMSAKYSDLFRVFAEFLTSSRRIDGFSFCFSSSLFRSCANSAEYLHICHKNDPKLIDCMKKSVEVIRPFLVRGIDELDIPSIDPIDIGDLLVSESTQGNGIQITAKDIKAFGASGFKIKNLE